MFIIWRGFGFLLPLGAMAGMAVVSVLLKSLFPSLPEDLVVGLGLVGAAVGTWGVAMLLEHHDTGREMIDARTGERFRLVRADSLFFIKARYWAYIVASFAVVFLAVAVFHLVSGGT